MNLFGVPVVRSAAGQAIAGKPSLLNALLEYAKPRQSLAIVEFRDAKSAAEKGETLQ